MERRYAVQSPFLYHLENLTIFFYYLHWFSKPVWAKWLYLYFLKIKTEHSCVPRCIPQNLQSLSLCLWSPCWHLRLSHMPFPFTLFFPCWHLPLLPTLPHWAKLRAAEGLAGLGNQKDGIFLHLNSSGDPSGPSPWVVHKRCTTGHRRKLQWDKSPC